MQYLVSVIDDTAGLATPEEMAAIDAFNDRLMAEGHWVFVGGLAAPSSATWPRPGRTTPPPAGRSSPGVTLASRRWRCGYT